MSDYPILTILLLLPLLGAVFIGFLIKGDDEKAIQNAQNTALWVTISIFIFSLCLWVGFDYSMGSFQFVQKFQWLKGYNINYHVGIDGISLFLILLTTFLLPICILASWNLIKFRVKEYLICFLVLESMIIGIFISLDILLFYVFFEAVLIPMFIIIGIWGGEKRVYASYKFFLYTLAGSLLFLVAIIYMYNVAGTTYIGDLIVEIPSLDMKIQLWLWIALFASFAIKVPMWPLHTWLPDAHVQAPTSGSVILAGVLLKLGGYGFIRLSLPILPDASLFFAEFMFILSVCAIIITSMIAFVQKDMKKLIAYSSVAHMGFVTLGAFALNHQGIEGSIMVMLSHGLVSAALFLCVGSLYNRLHTKEIDKFGGVTSVMPKFALFFMLFTMASIGLPSTSGFVGELLSLIGIFQVSKFYTALASLGIIFGAAYMLWLYARVMFGEIKNSEIKAFSDINKIELIMYVPIAVLVIIVGVYPSVITNVTDASVKLLLEQIQAGLGN